MEIELKFPIWAFWKINLVVFQMLFWRVLWPILFIVSPCPSKQKSTPLKKRSFHLSAWTTRFEYKMRNIVRQTFSNFLTSLSRPITVDWSPFLCILPFERRFQLVFRTVDKADDKKSIFSKRSIFAQCHSSVSTVSLAFLQMFSRQE